MIRKELTLIFVSSNICREAVTLYQVPIGFVLASDPVFAASNRPGRRRGRSGRRAIRADSRFRSAQRGHRLVQGRRVDQVAEAAVAPPSGGAMVASAPSRSAGRHLREAMAEYGSFVQCPHNHGLGPTAFRGAYRGDACIDAFRRRTLTLCSSAMTS